MTISTRQLTTADLDDAVSLLLTALPEIPLYSWILGESADDPDVATWLCRAHLRGHLANGTAIGALSGDALVGILTWASSGRPTPPKAPEETALDVAMLQSHLEMARRIAVTAQIERDTLTHPDPEAVRIEAAAVLAEHRNSGALLALMLPIETMCRDEGRRYTCWTGDETLRRVFTEVWNGTEYLATTVGDVPIYCLASDVGPPVLPRGNR